MKIFKNVLTILIISMIILFLNSCKRSTIEDPNMVDETNKLGRLQFSGSASPSVIYIPESRPEISSTISISLLNGDGTPASNIKIVFQKGDYGFFRGALASTTAQTDSNGIASVSYYIPKSTSNSDIMGDTYIQVKATVADDAILQGQANAVEQYITLRLIPYDSKDRIKIAGRITTCCPETGLECGLIALSNNGALADGVTQTRSSGSYDLMVPKGWSGVIAPSLAGYDFQPPEITIESPLYHDLNEMNFFAIVSDGYSLLSDFDAYTIPASGTTTPISANVYCNVSSCSISYRVASSATWLTINSGSTGTTYGTFTFSVSENTGESRSAQILIIGTDGQSESFTINVSQDSGSGVTLGSDFDSYEISGDGVTNERINVTSSDPDISIAYRVSVDVSWLTVTSGSTGNTPGSFTYTASANSTGEEREGKLIIVPTDREGASYEITITQSESTVIETGLVLSQDEFTRDNTATTAHLLVGVTHSDGTATDYTVTSESSWITIEWGVSKTTPEDFLFSIDANGTASQRTGRIMVRAIDGSSTKYVTIIQDA